MLEKNTDFFYFLIIFPVYSLIVVIHTANKNEPLSVLIVKLYMICVKCTFGSMPTSLHLQLP